MLSNALTATKYITVNDRKFRVETLAGKPDFNIVCMAFNEVGNTNLDAMNSLNEKIYNESSYVSGPVYKNDRITSKTALSREDYGDAPKNFVKRLGVPTGEWDRVGSVYVLRVCLLNPFISHNEHFDVLWDGFLAILKEKLAAAIAGDAKC